jgi:hypothetical protein
MEKDKVIELVFREIDILVQEQIMIVRQNALLEDRRIRCMDFIQNSEVLDISNEARKNLLTNVSNMEINVQMVASKVNDKEKGKDGEKCRYDDQGYCNYETKCKYHYFYKSAKNS